MKINGQNVKSFQSKKRLIPSQIKAVQTRGKKVSSTAITTASTTVINTNNLNLN